MLFSEHSLQLNWLVPLLLSVTISPLPAQDLRAVRDLIIDAQSHDLSDVNFVDTFRDGTIVVGQPQDHRLLFSLLTASQPEHSVEPAAAPANFAPHRECMALFMIPCGSVTPHWRGSVL
jgi:hypothetical protein